MLKDMELKAVITFHTTAEAMATEKACKERGIEGRLFPTPRSLTADCGIAWCGPADTRNTLEEMLSAEKIEYDGIHELEL